jgi:hypothetical protein
MIVYNSKADIIEIPIRGENYNWLDYQTPLRRTLTIEGAWHEEFCDLLDDSIEEVSINTKDGEIDLSFLTKFSNLKSLSISCSRVVNFDKTKELNQLDSLSFISRINQRLDFDHFNKLKTFSVDWKSNYKLDALPKTLEFLSVDKGSKLNWDNLLSGKPFLTKVELVDCDISSIDIIFGLPVIQYLALTGCKKAIFNINSKNDSLKFIDFRGVPINRLDWIRFLESIEIICINNAGQIESIRPIEGKSTITGLMFSGSTTFIDGDLDILETLKNLRNCFITGKRHYTHKTIENWNWKNFGQTPKRLIERR